MSWQLSLLYPFFPHCFLGLCTVYFSLLSDTVFPSFLLSSSFPTIHCDLQNGFWQDRKNEIYDHTTSVCCSWWLAGVLCIVPFSMEDGWSLLVVWSLYKMSSILRQFSLLAGILYRYIERTELLWSQIGFSFASVVDVCTVVANISFSESSSAMVEPRYLKVLTVSSFFPLALIFLLISLVLFIIMFIF